MGAPESADVSPEEEAAEEEQKRKAVELQKLRVQILRRGRGGALPGGVGGDQTLG